MAGQTPPNDAARLSEAATPSSSLVPRGSTVAVWALFLLSVGALTATTLTGAEWSVSNLLVVDGLTTVLWVVVTFFSGIVHSYSRRYMAGDRYLDGFYARILAFTLLVLTMAAADHVALFAAAWLGMGLVMSSLVGHDRDWPQARAAARSARRYFLASSGLLALGLVVLAWTTGATSIGAILGRVEGIPQTVQFVAVGSIFLAAIVQSALFPFHGWLLSSMTAPTPASALMHAGFVNAGGVLLTRFAPLIVDEPVVTSVIVVVGATSALLGQALLLVQPDVKHKLGASTVAQMGFMILQCGLGFFAAAITHLILHGFYKAYLFLSSGAAVEQTTPGRAKSTAPNGLGLAVSVVAAVGGGVLFAALTGKGTELDSGLVLTFVVVLTTMHAARDLLRRSTVRPAVRLGSVLVVVPTAIAVYATVYEAVSSALSGVPAVETGTELTVVHLVVAAAFVLAYLATELDVHHRSERLYVELVNASQPNPETVLTRTEDYDDA